MNGGPSLPQQRNLVTEIPGPESLARLDRKKALVADGVGTTLPVFVVAAGEYQVEQAGTGRTARHVHPAG